jgi:Spy/CpxP family protein refolding chaperone
MKSFYKTAAFGIAAAAMLLTAPMAIAQPDDEDFPPGRGPGGEEIENHVGQLGLSQEQQEKLDEYRSKHRRERRQLREKMNIKRSELKLELDKPETDKKKVAEIVAEMKKLEGEKIDQRVNSILELKELLTPEQFEKLPHPEMKGRDGKEHGRWHGKRRDCREHD